MNWHHEIIEFLEDENYAAIILFYENSIVLEPEKIGNYWLLGLAYLLAGREEEAYATWISTLAQSSQTDELLVILETEALRQAEENRFEASLRIREYIREIEPNLINNQLLIIILKVKLNISVTNEINQLTSLVKVSLQYLNHEFLKEIEILVSENNKHSDILPLIDLLELSLEIQSDNFFVLNKLANYYLELNNYQKAEEYIIRFIQYSSSLDLQLSGESFYLYILLIQGKWLEVESVIKDYKSTLDKFVKNPPVKLQNFTLFPLVIGPLFYLQDNPKETRRYQNIVSRFFQDYLRKSIDLPQISTFAPREKSKKLKIGYLASTLKRHSVGWLSRWLFYYHQHDSLEIHIYLCAQNEDDLTNRWFKPNADYCHNLSGDPFSIARKILTDKIDILVDLDSLTGSISCTVMALKPAPIQVSWLGFDAIGLPAIDYFIVDPYVVPNDAQSYYQEKLWILPKTYIAVDGFEIATPTLSRKTLGIPSDAVVYLTSQTAIKRHPETIKMQLKILNAVKNGYLLVKGGEDGETIKKLFTQLAQLEGIDSKRIKFLEKVSFEEIYRANLQIADVVLDTYPYNGATTTLEVLWLGIPIVTFLGEQFAARNSYSFMISAGITEGIASSSQEYVEWGIRLGLDDELRSSVHWKLIQGRKNSPLWKAKEFTKEMENAFFDMWDIYINSQD